MRLKISVIHTVPAGDSRDAGTCPGGWVDLTSTLITKAVLPRKRFSLAHAKSL